MERFSFVDVETTGLDPSECSVVEVAVLTTDTSGRFLDRYETVLNPLTKMAATRIHGIRAAAVAAAPTFSLIAPDLLERLNGTTVVAFNADFDRRFVENEVHRAGGHIAGDWICAMTEAARHTGGQRRLDDLAAELGVHVDGDAHSAARDAELCARIFFTLGAAAERPTLSTRAPTQRRVPPLPRTAADGQGTARRPVAANRGLERTGQPITTLVHQITAAFEDRELTLAETKQISLTADQAGLSAGDVIAAYNEYFEHQVVDILADGVIDDDERARLRVISHHLGFPAPYVEARLTGTPAPRLGAQLQPGMTIVLTGLDDETKWDLTMAAADAGIAIRHGVSKTTDLVVAGGQATTGKATKATELGIPIIDVQTFHRALPTATDPSIEPTLERVDSPAPQLLPPPTAPKGWYVDPTGRNEWRWWDGHTWTDNVGNNGTITTDPLP